MNLKIVEIDEENDLSLAQGLHLKRPKVKAQMDVLDATSPVSAMLCEEMLSDRDAVVADAVFIDVCGRLEPHATKIRVDGFKTDAE